MKFQFKIGDLVQVNTGKNKGQEAKVLFIDKKNKRVRLEGLKIVKAKGKNSKDLHGSFHVSHVTVKPSVVAAQA